MKTTITIWLLSISLLIGLPLVGLVLVEADLLSYLEFPPLTRYVTHAPFNLLAFISIGLVELFIIFGVISLFRIARRQSQNSGANHKHVARSFPVWGWLGVAIIIVGWILAWTRFPWFAPMQAHTFCLPWIGYILLVNALCLVRSGNSLLTNAPFRFLLLWPVSALFWWFFEYMNRFVQNWYYVGVGHFSPLEYFFHASLAFSTVLPAVLSTHCLLLTFQVFDTGLKHLVPLKHIENKFTSGIILIVAVVSLALIERFPDYLYPMVWIAPLLVITSLHSFWGKPTLLSGLKKGDWRAIIASATATLICGFFWELWNYYSLAHWEYAVPFVNRFRVFALPLLGYASYLLFGVECLLVGQTVIGNHLLRISTAKY